MLFRSDGNDFDRDMGAANNLEKRVICYSDGSVWGIYGRVGDLGSESIREELAEYLGTKKLPLLVRLPTHKKKIIEIEYNKRGNKIESVIEPGTSLPSIRVPPMAIAFTFFPKREGYVEEKEVVVDKVQKRKK